MVLKAVNIMRGLFIAGVIIAAATATAQPSHGSHISESGTHKWFMGEGAAPKSFVFVKFPPSHDLMT